MNQSPKDAPSPERLARLICDTAAAIGARQLEAKGSSGRAVQLIAIADLKALGSELATLIDKWENIPGGGLP